MLDSCCCSRFPLRKGTIIIGIVNVVGGCISTLVWIGILIYATTVVVQNEDSLSGDRRSATIGYLVTLSLNILTNAAHAVISYILVRGAQQGQPGRVKNYLVHGTSVIVMSMLSTAVSAVITLYVAVLVVIDLAVQAYFLLVIWSYYKQMAAESREVIIASLEPGARAADKVPKVYTLARLDSSCIRHLDT